MKDNTPPFLFPFFSTLRPVSPFKFNSASFLRLFCVYSASILRLFCIYSASFLRLFCVFSASILRLYRQSLSWNIILFITINESMLCCIVTAVLIFASLNRVFMTVVCNIIMMTIMIDD